MMQLGCDMYNYPAKSIIYTFGFTTEQYLSLGDDVKHMLINEYYHVMNNQGTRNEMDIINDEYVKEYPIKTKKLSIFKK